MDLNGFPLVDVEVCKPNGEGQQDQEQQELELLPYFLHREAQHPRSILIRCRTLNGPVQVFTESSGHAGQCAVIRTRSAV